MREPLPGIPPADVAAAVSTGWGVDVGRVVHLQVGFGAHHWRADTTAGALFATFDRVGPARDPATLEDAYASAAELAR